MGNREPKTLSHTEEMWCSLLSVTTQYEIQVPHWEMATLNYYFFTCNQRVSTPVLHKK